MAWIESHQKTLFHPKTIALAEKMGWDLDTAIGKLHRLWWWCVDYAEDGDLRRYSDSTLAMAAGVAPQDAKKFVESMVSCGGEIVSGFIDREPYFRIHNWWHYIGRFLQSKYGKTPEKWEKIKYLYKKPTNHVNTTCKPAGNHKHQPNQPNLTKPNQPNQPKEKPPIVPLKKGDELFEKFWKAYPRKVGKGAARKVWAKIRFQDGLFEQITKTLGRAIQSPQWNKDHGQFIPHPATWLGQERWHDEIKLPQEVYDD